MRIVLVNPWTYPLGIPHFGLLYIASYLRRHLKGVSVKVIEDSEPLSEILASKPDMVGITSNTTNFTKAVKVAEEVKRRSNAVTVIGGCHITALPHALPECFDAGVLGEGEQTTLELARVVGEYGYLKDDCLRRIDGLAFRDRQGLVLTSPREQISPLDSLPYPARDLIDWDEYYGREFNLFRKERYHHIITSRGCISKCVFCGSPVQWRGVRLRSAESIVAEIEDIIATYGAQTITFWDDFFAWPLERIRKLSSEIVKRNIHKGVNFMGMGRAGFMSEEICSLLKKMNVSRLTFGLESGSERVLRYLKGGACSVKDNALAVALCRKYGLSTSSGYIYGAPGEDASDLEATYNFIRHNRLDNTQLYALVPWPGTQLWETARQRGAVTDTMDDFGRIKILPSAFGFRDLFRRRRNVINAQVKLNDDLEDDGYRDMVFKIARLIYLQNLWFWIKQAPRNLGLVWRIIKARRYK